MACQLDYFVMHCVGFFVFWIFFSCCNLTLQGQTFESEIKIKKMVITWTSSTIGRQNTVDMFGHLCGKLLFQQTDSQWFYMYSCQHAQTTISTLRCLASPENKCFKPCRHWVLQRWTVSEPVTVKCNLWSNTPYAVPNYKYFSDETVFYLSCFLVCVCGEQLSF